jgi:hypothetical protein
MHEFDPGRAKVKYYVKDADADTKLVTFAMCDFTDWKCATLVYSYTQSDKNPSPCHF